jgi:OOP family OmpA-OmpF porin
MKTTGKVLLASALLAALPAMAQQMPAYSPWYFGVGVGQGHLGASGNDLTGLDNAQLDNRETTYTVRGGWRFSPYGAIELGYYDLGKYAFHAPSVAGDIDGEAKAKSWGISLVGILPLNQLDLYGRIGYAHSELKANASADLIATPFNEKDTQNEATYGIGGRWTFVPQWALFAEWMKNDKIKVDSYLIGIDFKF